MKPFSARPRRLTALALLTAFAAVALFGAACSSDKDPTATATVGQPITFPYVLSGSFTVGGEPGTAGSKIFTMINGKQSGQVTEALRDGEYNNLIAGVNSLDDIGKKVTVHLGDPNGDNVEAEETFIFNAPSGPQFLSVDLTFPALP